MLKRILNALPPSLVLWILAFLNLWIWTFVLMR